MDLRETRSEDVNGIELNQNMFQWPAYLNMCIAPLSFIKAGTFSSKITIISLWRKTLLQCYIIETSE
jgi:hypothetical protein